MRNPDWTKDEVILALDLYFRAGRKQLPSHHQDVIQLSELLKRLPFHDSGNRTRTFRNPNGISMILGNFLGVDPTHTTPGLSRNSKLHEEAWKEFGDHVTALRQTSKAITQVLMADPDSDVARISLDIEDEFPEGKLLSRIHIARERNCRAVENKKSQVLAKTGRLACEACGFDFGELYGILGAGFAECHHRLPLADLPFQRRTRLADLAIVCANCHRVLHRARPVLTIEALSEVIRRHRDAELQRTLA